MNQPNRQVIFEVVDQVGWLTLNRPDKLNALTPDMAREAHEAVVQVRDDPSIKVLVLTGAGRGFCSGADTRGLLDDDADTAVALDHGGIQRFTMEMFALDKPTVVAINGPCVGAGFELTLPCDVRFASDTAYFMEAAMRHALVPGDGSVLMLPKIVGLARANDILLSGRKVDAVEAQQIGLVKEVVPHDQLLDRVRAFASHLAALDSGAVAMLKQGIRMGIGGPEFSSVLSFLRLAVAQGRHARRDTTTSN